MPNMVNFASFFKTLSLQTVLPDRSLSIEQKMVENAKIGKFQYDILGDFQTLWNIATTNFCPLKSNLSGNTV